MKKLTNISDVLSEANYEILRSIPGDNNCMNDWLYYADYGRFCGTTFPAAGVPTSDVTPFLFQFITDAMEREDNPMVDGVAGANTGFRLDYTQTVC